VTIRSILLSAILLAVVSVAARAETQVDATVDRTSVPIDGQIVYTVTISGGLRQAPTPELPALDKDWTVYSAGTSRNFSIVNGQVSSSSSYRYVLTPRRTGTLTIGRASVTIGNTTVQTDPITINVTAAQGGASGAPSPGLAPGEERASGSDRELFITTSVSKKKPYVQEQIILTFRFYQRVNLLESPDYTAPTTTGFWSEDLPPQRTFNEVINGRRYYVTEVRTALFATAPGTFTISGARLECSVPSVRRNIDRDPFSLFGQSMFESKRVTLTSDPIEVQVQPLPANAPKEFAGAVGQFTISGRLDKTTIPQGEPVTLNVEVTGVGNVKTVPDLTFPVLQEFKVYDSSSSSEVSKDGGIVRGRKSYQQILVPLKAGSLTVPPVSLAYFDPSVGDYRTVQTQSFAIQVTPGSGGSSGPGASRGAIEVVGQDIRFIRQELKSVRTAGRRLWDSPLFWIFQVLPIGAVIGSLLYESHRRRLEEDEGFARGLRSNREAGKRLKRARALAATSGAGFYSEVSAAIRGYVADKFNRSAAGLTHQDIEALLARRGVNGDLSGRLVRLLDTCDMARYAPAADGAGDRERLLAEAGEILISLRKAGV
jgi:hypothetical protein